MVTPHDPAVEELIRVAADYHPYGLMTSGYNTEHDESGSVWNRLEAIWRAEDEYYDLTYIMHLGFLRSGCGAADSHCQQMCQGEEWKRIELALFTLRQRKHWIGTGDCPVPGHAYVGGEDRRRQRELLFIETT
jgi:hypothetical protein